MEGTILEDSPYTDQVIQRDIQRERQRFPVIPRQPEPQQEQEHLQLEQQLQPLSISGQTSMNRTKPLSRPSTSPPNREYDYSLRSANSRVQPPVSPRYERREVTSSARSQRPTSPRYERGGEDAFSHTPSTRLSEDGERGRASSIATVATGHSTAMADFFSPEVFQIVLSNPTTAHRFMRFCQSRACGENMEFLREVDKYLRLLDAITTALSSIQSSYTSPTAHSQINIPSSATQHLAHDIRYATATVIPSLETIFHPASEHIRKLLSQDIYPRFVKHQITTSATMALTSQRERYAGLGDCFCLTDPARADNPIIYASDGFVNVTGYSRRDIIPRNCRFLQGALTDRLSVQRLKKSILACEETVELLLNYRKSGEPFWNLLYMAPLLGETGRVEFFLGGQINCSTTIHSYVDVLRVLSVDDDELDELERMEKEGLGGMGVAPNGKFGKDSAGSLKSGTLRAGTAKLRSNFFKTWRKIAQTSSPAGMSPNESEREKIHVRQQAGMENELLNRVGRSGFGQQIDAFYTAYSKYLVLKYQDRPPSLIITHYSPSVIDILGLNLPNGGTAPIFGKDIFKLLSSGSGPSSSLKATVFDAFRVGKAVSVEVAISGLGYVVGALSEREREKKGWFSGSSKSKKGTSIGEEVEKERFIGHWTPLKDESGGIGWVVLTIAPRV